MTKAYPSAAELCVKVFDDLKLPLTVPDELECKPASEISDRPFGELTRQFMHILGKSAIGSRSVRSQAESLARRAQLTRAFEQPDEVMARITASVPQVMR